MHKYAYVHGDPIGNIDPLGLFSVASTMAGNAIASQLNQMTFDNGVSIIEMIDPDNDIVKKYRQVEFAIFVASVVASGGVALFNARKLFNSGRGLVRKAISNRSRVLSLLGKPFNRLWKKSAFITGSSPRVTWIPNAPGQVRTLDEGLAIAQANGVVIPPGYKFVVADPGELPEHLTAKGANITKHLDDHVGLDDLVNVNGEIIIKVNPKVLESDEAITAVVAHEVFEHENFKILFDENGGTIRFREFIAEAAADNEQNLHWQAWDYADAIIEAMRGS